MNDLLNLAMKAHGGHDERESRISRCPDHLSPVVFAQKRQIRHCFKEVEPHERGHCSGRSIPRL